MSELNSSLTLNPNEPAIHIEKLVCIVCDWISH